MSPAQAQALWSRLAAAGVVSGTMPSAPEPQAPWYVRVMLGIAGVIAALFLLGFVGVGFAFVIKNAAVSVSVGIAVIAGAFAIFRAAARSDFAVMFALSVSFAGQALIGIGLFDLLRAGPDALAWIIFALLQAVLALVVRHFIHRLASAYLAGVALAFAMADAGIGALAVGLLGAAVAALWLNELPLATRRELLSPIAYGVTLAYLQAEISGAFGDSLFRLVTATDVARVARWAGQALVAGALLATAAALLRRAGWKTGDSRSVLALVVCAAIGLASFKAPGIAGGLMIVLLGFANGNRLLAGAGIAALLIYIGRYYYMLDLTLLVKSGVLAATGGALLLARWIFLRFLVKTDA